MASNDGTFERLKETAVKVIRERDQLKAENRKLLELVGIMRTCIEHACLCDFCPLFAAEDMDEPRCIAEMDSRMRELGVD